jgi:hypothetical protein
MLCCESNTRITELGGVTHKKDSTKKVETIEIQCILFRNFIITS